MSKSYDNAVMLTDPELVVRQKLKTMVTDPARVRRTDRGNPDVCPVGDLHKIFSSPETKAKVERRLPFGRNRLHRVQELVADAIVKILNPMQERRKKYEISLASPGIFWSRICPRS